MTQMKAWQVQSAGEPREVLHLVDLPLPEPGPGQLRVRVAAAGIGLPDVLMCRGVYPMTPALPFTPGQEVAGTVTAVGEGVQHAVGDQVMAVTSFIQGHGSFAEECLVDVTSAFLVPAGLSHAAAAGFWIPHLTAWVGLVDRGGLVAGDTLAVLGAAGGSGIAAIQLGKALGARTIAVVSDRAKADFATSLGADEVVVSGPGSSEPVAARLRELTGGNGVDLVYDPVGGAPAEDAARGLARGGRLLAVGFAAGDWPSISTIELVISNISLVGVFAGGYTPDELDDIHARLSALVADGSLRDAVCTQVGFDDLPTAVQALADRTVVGKQVMVP